MYIYIYKHYLYTNHIHTVALIVNLPLAIHFCWSSQCVPPDSPCLRRILRPASIWSAVIRWGLAATSVWSKQGRSKHSVSSLVRISPEAIDVIRCHCISNTEALTGETAQSRMKEINDYCKQMHCTVWFGQRKTWVKQSLSNQPKKLLFPSLPSWISCSLCARGRMLLLGTWRHHNPPMVSIGPAKWNKWDKCTHTYMHDCASCVVCIFQIAILLIDVNCF